MLIPSLVFIGLVFCWFVSVAIFGSKEGTLVVFPGKKFLWRILLCLVTGLCKKCFWIYVADRNWDGWSWTVSWGDSQDGGKLDILPESAKSCGNGKKEWGVATQIVCYRAGDSTGELDLEEKRESEDLKLVCMLQQPTCFFGYLGWWVPREFQLVLGLG